MDKGTGRRLRLQNNVIAIIRNHITQKTYICWIKNPCILCAIVISLHVFVFLSLFYEHVQKQGRVKHEIFETQQEIMRVEILDEQLFLQMRYLKSLLKDKNTPVSTS